MKLFGNKRDANEPAIVRRLEAHGFLWLPNNAKGRPDGCALHRGTFWCEVKQPGESFTPEQVDTFSAMARAGVPVYVLETVEDADALAAGTLAAWTVGGITIRDAKKTHTAKHIPGKSRARTTAEQCAAGHCATSKAPGSKLCTACGSQDAVPPPRATPAPPGHVPACTREQCRCPRGKR